MLLPTVRKKDSGSVCRCQASFAVEGSKQPQVSVLPEWRVKKQRQTALTGYFRDSQESFFCCRIQIIPGGSEYIMLVFQATEVLRLNKSQPVPRSDARVVSRVPVRRIHAGPDQPRRNFPEESIAQLAESIRRHGLLSPLLVRAEPDGNYRLIAGERRLRALKLLGRPWAEVILLADGDCECALIALVENLQREELHFLDMAAACRQILDTQPITQQQLAAGLSMSPSALANRLRLLKLPEDVQAAVREGGLSERHARALLHADGEAAQRALAAQAAERRLSVVQLEALVDQRRAAVRVKPRPCPIVRDNRIVINALMDTVRQLKRIGVPVKSRVEPRENGVDVVISIPAPGKA